MRVMPTVFGITLLLPYSVFAANYFYCNGSGQYVYIGDSLDQVQAKCGSPASNKTEQTSSKKATPVTMWVYNAKQTMNSNNLSGYSNQSNTSGEAMLIVNFINYKVSSIVEAGQNVDSSKYCGLGGEIDVGDPETKIRYYCGTPNSVQQVTQTVPTPSETQTIITYNQEYGSPVTLTFDGKNQLISIDP